VIEPQEEEPKYLRPVNEVSMRCHAISAVLALLDGAPADRVKRNVEQHGLRDWFADDEAEFFEAHTARRLSKRGARSDLDAPMSWRAESLWALLWALGVADHLDPTKFAG
jgi:hypothetical protein